MEIKRLKLPINSSAADILDLRHDQSRDTMLVIDEYDNAHNIQAGTEFSRKSWERLEKVLEKALAYNKKCPHQSDNANKHKECVLELASGTGNISLGIADDEQVRHLVISDISPGMLKKCQEKLSSLQRKNYKLLLFDANEIPFEDSQFNLIVGNSVLHHLENFEITLRECKRVLKPGGACIFGEPILNSQALLSLFCSLALKISELTNHALEKKQKLILSVISEKASRKRKHLDTVDRAELRIYEDKFQFPVEYMKRLCVNDIGFSSAQCLESSEKAESPCEKIASIRRNLSRIFSQHDEDSSTLLAKYEFILESIRETYLEPLAGETYGAFQYFVMTK